MAKAKSMNRSRNQLATAYAPESFFTFEGGMGACIARSSAGEPIQLSESTIDLVFERMNEPAGQSVPSEQQSVTSTVSTGAGSVDLLA